MLSPPPSLLLGIIVPATLGTKSSGPRSPTIEALPTGGRPPFANKPPYKPPAIFPKNPPKPPLFCFAPKLSPKFPNNLSI